MLNCEAVHKSLFDIRKIVLWHVQNVQLTGIIRMRCPRKFTDFQDGRGTHSDWLSLHRSNPVSYELNEREGRPVGLQCGWCNEGGLRLGHTYYTWHLREWLIYNLNSKTFCMCTRFTTVAIHPKHEAHDDWTGAAGPGPPTLSDDDPIMNRNE